MLAMVIKEKAAPKSALPRQPPCCKPSCIRIPAKAGAFQESGASGNNSAAVPVLPVKGQENGSADQKQIREIIPMGNRFATTVRQVREKRVEAEIKIKIKKVPLILISICFSICFKAA